MTTPIAPGIATPDEVETSIGTLKLHDGVPSDETTKTIYDNLDRSRALQAYLLGIPIVNQVAMRNALREYGPVNTTDVIWENLVDSKTVELTANDNTVYSFIWLDTSKGPLVVEIPPKVLGLIDDMWYRWVADVGITGADHGKGGKYLILPPGYKGEVPDGYFVVRPSTYGNWMPFRSFLVDGSPKPGVDLVKKTLKIYPLGDEAHPQPIKYVNLSGVPSTFVAPADYSFWELLNEAIQEEPPEGSDPTTLGLFASIGIEKGKPFAPDERMKKILADAANIGAVTARTIGYKMRDKNGFIYPDSYWRKPFFGGYKFEVSPGSAISTARSSFTSWPPASHRRWPKRWWEKARSTHGRRSTPTETPSTGQKPTSYICRRTSRPRISGRSSFTTPRRVPCCRPTSSSRACRARTRT